MWPRDGAEESFDEMMSALAERLAAWTLNGAPVVLERHAAAPSIFIDLPGTPIWKPLANVDGWSLRLEPGLVARDGV